jgi:hypothetical protein
MVRLLFAAVAAVVSVMLAAGPAWAQDEPDDDPSWWEDPLGSIGREISQAINRWFFETLREFLPTVLDAMAGTVLATPEVGSHPQVQTVWTSSLVLADALLVLFVVAGGYIIASRDTLQTSYELKEIAPRIVIAALATHLSLFLVTQLTRFTNALTGAIAADGMAEVVAVLETMVDEQAEANVLMLMLLAVLMVMAIIVIVTFIIRMVVLVALVAAAPLALLCHATPYTEQVAFLWWRALTGVFIIQVGQSLVVVVTVQVFLTDAGETFVGFPITGGGWLGVLVGVTMLWLLVKIPMWTREYLWMHSRRVFSKLIFAYMMLRTLGQAVAGSASGASRGGGGTGGGPRPGPGGGGGPGGGSPRQPNPSPRTNHRPNPRSGNRPNPRPNPRPRPGPGPRRGPSGPTPPPGPPRPGPTDPSAPPAPGSPPSPSRSDPTPAPGEPSGPDRQPGTPSPRPVPRREQPRPQRSPRPGPRPAPAPPGPPDRRPPDRRPPARPAPRRTPVGATGGPGSNGLGGVQQPVRLARNPAPAASRPPANGTPQRPAAATGPVTATRQPRPIPAPAPVRPVGRR